MVRRLPRASHPINNRMAPELIKRKAIGYESASQLLITGRNNPQRLRSESVFAALCGVSSVPVSYGNKPLSA